MVCVPDAVSPVSLLPAVNVTTTLSPTFAVLPLVGETDVTENVGAVTSDWKVTEVLNAYVNCPKTGLNTIINNKTLLEWGKILFKLSKAGLEKRSIKNENGKDESIFLRSIENILKNNKTKADIAIEKFNKNKSLDFMYEKTQ